MASVQHSIGRVVVTALIVVIGGCQDKPGTTPQSGSATPPALQPAPPATPTDDTRARAETAATAATGLPGQPSDVGPKAGDVVAVVGVAHNDRLNLRARPGREERIIGRIAPQERKVTARGRTRHLEHAFWTAVEHEGTEGWVHLKFIGYVGDTTDETAAVIARLGQRPEANTMSDLGRVVAESFASEEPKSDVIMTAAPAIGDLGEVTYDVLNIGDDSIRGLRVHVFGAAFQSRFALRSVEVTQLCGRGVTKERLCM